jgi:maltooligosyltrehalose trehalohydrolase
LAIFLSNLGEVEMEIVKVARKLPIGAEVFPEGGVHFRVWSPRCKRVEIVIEKSGSAAGTTVELSYGEDGYFSGFAQTARAGSLYRFRLDGSDYLYPDPASRYQPEGPHGPSCVVDPTSFRWTDNDWRGVNIRGQVIYEMHVGTFTKEGTLEAASRELPELAAAGITVIELMPLAEFPGNFGWGYDGVDLFAPTRLYGEPDDLRRFIDRAHSVGIAVIHDVVYNHLGPDGNYLKQFSEDYFTDRYENEWGEAINFDGKNSGPVREFFTSNAKYWIDEFHFDGLRLDATQQIFDNSGEHILAEVTRKVREAAGRRSTILIAENEPQHAKLVKPLERGGYGLDGLWNDDLHHSAMVALTGHNEAYYTDYLGKPQEFISAFKWGYIYQGQRYKWQKHRRGTPTLDLEPEIFVTFMQNHDQVANSASGQRCHLLTSPGKYRAMTALILLGPGTPMLFQGQEFAASSPFLYFADHKKDLAVQVKKGRGQFLQQFPTLATPAIKECLPDPADPNTFERSKLNLEERESNKEYYDLHRDLLKLRREDPLFRSQRKGGLDGAVLGTDSLVLRFFGEVGDDRILLVNFGVDLHLDPAPEPLLAPPEGMRWKVLWSSEDPRYGGCGTPELDTEENWLIPGHAAVVLFPVPEEENHKDTKTQR